MRTLDEIMLATGTDKNSAGHGYAERYDALFTPFRERPITLLEIGVWEGAGLLAYAEYFTHPSSSFIGFDVDTWRYVGSSDPRIHVIQTDVTSDVFGHMIEAIDPPTIAIDDGSHRAEDQIKAFSAIWPKLVAGGLYIVEDLHTMYWPRANPAGSVDWLYELAGRSLGEGAERYRGEFESVEFSPSLAVIRKRGVVTL